MSESIRVLALAGGVGGAKLAAGLGQLLGERLTVLVNTGDDFEHLGLHVSPDLDTVMCTLAGIANPETGWGIAGESWTFMEQLERLGGQTWFRLGDRDLATHTVRTSRLARGDTLAAITADICRALNVAPTILPMTDDRVRTIVHSGGALAPSSSPATRPAPNATRSQPAVRNDVRRESRRAAFRYHPNPISRS